MKLNSTAHLTAALAFCLSACFEERVPLEPENTGTATIHATLKAPASLGKVSAESPSMAVFRLTKSGEQERVDSIPLTAGGGQSIIRNYAGLAAGEWSLSVKSMDGSAMAHHSGSTIFYVTPGKTASVQLSLESRFVILKAALFPFPKAAARSELSIDGAVRASGSSGSGVTGDTARLQYDYLEPGLRKIGLKVYGDAQIGVLYEADTLVNVVAGSKVSLRLRMKGLGSAAIVAVFETAGELFINGEIPDMACVDQPAGSGWNDGFGEPALDQAWSVWEYAGTRHNGQTMPANHFEIVGNALRYIVDPMTQDASLYGYLPWQGNPYLYDPGLEISRPLTGTRWMLEFKADYYLPLVVNAAGFHAVVQMGPSWDSAFNMDFFRYSNDDLGYNMDHNIFGASAGDSSWNEQAPYVMDITRWVRMRRNEEKATVEVSQDSTTWTLVASGTIPAALRCQPQKLIISGDAWFSPGGSRADYDYFRFSAY